jgi:outer membrane lipoprotein-sorting protein
VNPPILQRHPALRWLVPVGVACLAGLAATGVFKATASSESLPQTTPTALIAAVQNNQVEGFSGTVVSHLSLGLPELPALPAVSEDTSFNALLSGSHTMQVWYGGVDKQRVALLGATDETDLFRNGRTVWQWSSSDAVATHAVLPLHASAAVGGSPAAVSASLTPAALARRALDAIDPSTDVTVDGDHTVADRSAYELVLTPRSDRTKVGSVHISVDGATKVPLGVQVYPRGSSSAAIDVAFTSIRFGAQASRNFVFSPPPNAQIRELAQSNGESHVAARRAADTTGTGWATVVGLKPGGTGSAGYVKSPLVKQLTPVSGSWGKGRLLDSDLVSVLVTDDGRVYAGAVDPADLYAAAGSK